MRKCVTKQVPKLERIPGLMQDVKVNANSTGKETQIAEEKDSGFQMMELRCSGHAIESKGGIVKIEEEQGLQKKVAELEEEGEKMKQRLAELQKIADSLKLESISSNTTMEATFKAMQELEKDAAEMKEALKSSNDEREMLKKECIGITERVKELEAANERETEKKEVEKEEMLAAHQREIKDYRMTLKYWLKNIPIIDKQSKTNIARANRLTVQLAAAKKDCEKSKNEIFAVQVETSVLETENLQYAQDLKQQIKLRGEEAAAKEESIKVVDEMKIEKGSLVKENKELSMKKNRLIIKCDNLNQKLVYRENQLEKAQEYARELEEEKHLKRLNKRKGLKRLMRWKRN